MKVEDLVPGRHYKYKGIWGMMGLWKGELQLYPADEALVYNEVWGQYNPLAITTEIAAELEEWPTKEVEEKYDSQRLDKYLMDEYSPLSFPSPKKKAKEIALEAALKLYVPSSQTADLLLRDAQKIFEWMTKDEAQVPLKNLNP